MAGAWEGGRGVCQPEGAGLLVREGEEGHGKPLRERGEEGEGECDGSEEVGDMPGGPLTLKPRCSSCMGKHCQVQVAREPGCLQGGASLRLWGGVQGE